MLGSKLEPGLDELVSSVERRLDGRPDQDEIAWRVYRGWSNALRRVLLRARSYRHGGAFLVADRDAVAPHLNVKYDLPYDRLTEAIEVDVVANLTNHEAEQEIWQELESGGRDVSRDDYFTLRATGFDLTDLEKEINGAVWFISLLTRVDGLVLLDPALRVYGFGVEITADDAPAAVHRSRNPNASRLTPINYNHYGTRHRSMMRLCAAVPEAVGFVISQDGAIRAVTSGPKGVVMWDDLTVQRLDISRSPRVKPRP